MSSTCPGPGRHDRDGTVKRRVFMPTIWRAFSDKGVNA
jgi:hypothetical protein